LILEPELAPKSVALLARASRPVEDVENFLLEQMTKQPASRAPFGLALALHLKEIGSTERAIGLLRSLMERMPRFWEARKELGSLLLAQNRAEELRAEYQDILATLGQPVMGFACRACRQRLPEHVFRCPACESWDTVTREE
jgi:lipopolysaccharide biosynthesis regulator YciM